MPQDYKNKHKQQQQHHHVRYLPLLLLMFYALVSILKLATPPPLISHMDINKEIEPLKTHISSSNGQRLQVHEEKRGDIRTEMSCDRSQYRTDICYMRGDIRTEPGTSSFVLYNAGEGIEPETIRPYTRKWESEVMDTIHEIKLRPVVAGANVSRRCDVEHKGVPGVVFSAGGYTGNVYHEFNDGLIPLYITAQGFEREVVLLVNEYHAWWFGKYRSVLKRLSKYKVVDLAEDRRVHCFDEVIVGLKIHGELTIDPNLMPNGKGIQDFQALLGRGFSTAQPPSLQLRSTKRHLGSDNDGSGRPKIAIFIRHRSRVLYNIKEIIRFCHRLGFQVQTLDPKRTTPLADIYEVVNSSDVMLAVHGAAMTHFLFMRPTSVVIQIVPLGLDWPAETYYGEPTRKVGLEYMAYKVAPEESSLTKIYGRSDPVIMDPSTVTSKGWSEMKKIYLDKQNVRVNMRRFGKVLEKAHSHVVRQHSTL